MDISLDRLLHISQERPQQTFGKIVDLLPLFKETVHDENWDNDFSDLEERFFHIFPKTLVIKPSHPFYDTDLVVVNDEYKGVLPLNGIKQSEFDYITEQYNQILTGKSCIALTKDNAPLEVDDPSFIEFAQCLKKLLSRESGRLIVSLILEPFNHRPIQINLISGNAISDAFYKEGKALLNFNLKQTLFVNTISTTPRKLGANDDLDCIPKERTIIPSYITLGHELLHLIHYFEDLPESKKRLQTKPNMNLTNYHKVEGLLGDLEEQFTIVGYKNKLIFDQALSKESDAEEEDNFSAYLPKHYSLRCENELRQQFGLSPRVDHEGSLMNLKPFSLMDYASEEYGTYLYRQITCGRFPEIAELIENGLDLNQTFTFDHKEFVPLELAVKINNKKMISWFIKIGAFQKEICFKIIENLVELRNEIIPMLELLNSLGVDLHQVNDSGESLCHVAYRRLQSDENMFSWLNEQGFLFNQKNNFGYSVYDLAALDGPLCLEKINKFQYKDPFNLAYEAIQDEIYNKTGRDFSRFKVIYSALSHELKTKFLNDNKILVFQASNSDLEIEKLKLIIFDTFNLLPNETKKDFFDYIQEKISLEILNSKNQNKDVWVENLIKVLAAIPKDSHIEYIKNNFLISLEICDHVITNKILNVDKNDFMYPYTFIPTISWLIKILKLLPHEIREKYLYENVTDVYRVIHCIIDDEIEYIRTNTRGRHNDLHDLNNLADILQLMPADVTFVEDNRSKITNFVELIFQHHFKNYALHNKKSISFFHRLENSISILPNEEKNHFMQKHYSDLMRFTQEIRQSPELRNSEFIKELDRLSECSLSRYTP